MLILSRRTDESVVIGDDIIIQILSVRGGHIRLGIMAPRDISVHRQEVYDRIKVQEARKEEDEVE